MGHRSESPHEQAPQWRAEFLRAKLLRSTRSLMIAEDIARLGNWVWELPSNCVYWSEGLYRILGRIPSEEPLSFESAFHHIHPEDRERVEQKLHAFLEGGIFEEWEYRLLRDDGTIRLVQVRYLEIKKNPGGQPLLLHGVTQDITDAKETTQSIIESTRKLRASSMEKEILLKEVHHRVKNNLQIISSLINLQCNALCGEEHVEVFKILSHRVRSMALVHEELYKSGDFANVNFADYTRDLLSYLLSAYSVSTAGIPCDMKLAPVMLSVATAVPCGLILNELIANALTHGLRDRPNGQLSVRLGLEPDGRARLSVGDNGVGMPLLVGKPPAGRGLRLVHMLCRQIGAELKFKSAPGQTTFHILFTPRLASVSDETSPNLAAGGGGKRLCAKALFL
ncbi:MAG: sensor histidine kinase [Terrimicrobiaceae bacterium]